MRILLLSWNAPPALGGIEYLVWNLFHGLRKAGHDVRLVTAWSPHPEKDADVRRAPARGLKRYLRYSFTEGFSLCRSFRPDVILCGSLTTAPAAYALSRLFKLPYHVIIHGSDVLRKGFVYQRAVRYLLRRADGLICNSGQTRAILAEMRMPEARLHVIHPGVRVEDYREPPQRGAEEILRQCQGRRVILTVGRLIRRKGVLEFVQNVMPRLVAERPDAILLIVGDDATASLVHPERLRERIAARVTELNLDNHVKLLGKVADEDLLRLFYRADLFVLPVLSIPGDVEGFGIVFQEAALAGAPSVSTRTGGIPEAIQDGVTGLLVEPGDHEAMRAAVIQLLNDEPLRRRLAAAAADRARREFAWETIVSKYQTVLKPT